MDKTKLMIAIALFGSVSAYPQGKVEVAKNLNYRQSVTPQDMDNYLFSNYYYFRKNVYNLKGFELMALPSNVVGVKVNPAGASYAALCTNGKRWELGVYDVNIQKRKIHSFEKTVDARAFCYSADSKVLFVADAGGVLRGYDTREYKPGREMVLGFVPLDMQTSSNGYFLAAQNGSEVVIVNVESLTVRQRISGGGRVEAMAFSPDAAFLGVLSGGVLSVYNTADFKLVSTVNGLDGATSFAFHPEGKYVAVARNGNNIGFYNIYDSNDSASLTEPRGSVSRVKFVNDAKNLVYLTYNTNNAICYKVLKGLKPNYTRLMRDELNARMMEWCKRGADETETEYNERVNEETKKRQKRVFANEISTSLAGDIIARTSVSLGKYNTASQTLEVKLDNMPAVYLNVPQNEIPDFNDAGNLEFCDVQYGITSNDSFEVIFAKVRNKANGKEYVFDNTERQSLDLLATDDNFVSLDLIQQASREDIALQRIKNNVVSKAKERNLISDHTKINVSTRVLSDVNANGERINNYSVEFDYSVEVEYSAQEDFAPGKYRVDDSHAAKSTLQIITKAFADEFAQYIKPGKKVIVNITGSADAIPVVGTIAYDGCYGEFENEPYWLDGNLSNITVTSKGGLRTNEQLAFMRGRAVEAYLREKMPALASMQVEPRYNVYVAEDKGGEYRRIKVNFVFVDALE